MSPLLASEKRHSGAQVNCSCRRSAIITAEASPFTYFDGHLKGFLDEAGCNSTVVRLADQGGHGHGMMLKRSNAEVLGVIHGWIAGLTASMPH